MNARGAAAGQGQADDGGDVEVVPSGNALCVVSGWLGMTEEEALAEAGPTAASTEPAPARRQQFLGLGAKYLPHHKAVETATALDNKLRRRLERGLAARQEAEEEEALEHRGGKRPRTDAAPGREKLGRGGLLPAHGGGGGKRAAQEAAKELEDEEEEEEEEVERKGAAPAKSRTHGAGHKGGGGAQAARPAAGTKSGAGDGGAKGQSAASASVVAKGTAATAMSSKAAREALLLAPVNSGNKNKKSKLKS